MLTKDYFSNNFSESIQYLKIQIAACTTALNYLPPQNHFKGGRNINIYQNAELREATDTLM